MEGWGWGWGSGPAMDSYRHVQVNTFFAEAFSSLMHVPVKMSRERVNVT